MPPPFYVHVSKHKWSQCLLHSNHMTFCNGVGMVANAKVFQCNNMTELGWFNIRTQLS